MRRSVWSVGGALLEDVFKFLGAFLLDKLKLGNRLVLGDGTRLEGSLDGAHLGGALVLDLGDLLEALLDARGLGAERGMGAGVGAWTGSVAAAGVGAPRVGTRATHASSAVALVVVPVLRGRASEEEKYEQDDGEDLPACGWEARVGFVRNLRNRALFLRSFLASSSRMFRLRGAASGGTRGGRAGVSPAGSRPNGVGGYNLKTWRETGRDAYLCGRPGGGRARGGRATVAAARVE